LSGGNWPGLIVFDGKFRAAFRATQLWTFADVGFFCATIEQFRERGAEISRRMNGRLQRPSLQSSRYRERREFSAVFSSTVGFLEDSSAWLNVRSNFRVPTHAENFNGGNARQSADGNLQFWSGAN
jgi:hypothetical protein